VERRLRNLHSQTSQPALTITRVVTNAGVSRLTKAKFGCQLPQEISDFEKLAEVAQECERLGYDSVWAYDHLAPYWTQRGEAFECWTLLAAIAQRTKTVKLGSLVTNVNLRSPALLAKITSTLDNISHGRLILGVGTGDSMSREELLSHGHSFASLEERVQRLKETILILKALWTEDRTSFNGTYNKLSNAVSYPKPIQTPHPPIWVGGKHLKILDVVAETADGWNYWGLSKEVLTRSSRYLRDKCTRIGRDPNQLTKSWAGRLSHVIRAGANPAKVVDNIAMHLKNQTDHETKYFIANLGPRASLSMYQAFADAVRSLQ
jgi:alkanesulfonate monooxygenase SsuD/methylene tetrahydromethanopterin reductase-like flavin-dependent oxidoreductase (luciferase family)